MAVVVEVKGIKRMGERNGETLQDWDYRYGNKGVVGWERGSF